MLNVNIISSKYMKIICFECELGPSIIVIIKTSSTGPSGKSKVAFTTPQAPASRKTEENTTHISNQRLIAPMNPAMVLATNTLYREGQSTFEPGRAENTLQIGTFYTLIPRTPMDELRPQLGYALIHCVDIISQFGHTV